MSQSDLTQWKGVPAPDAALILEGRFVRLEPVDPDRHAKELFAAATDPRDDIWQYMYDGPFEDMAAFRRYLDPMVDSRDPVYRMVIDLATGRPAGITSYLRIDTANGSVEIGHIWYGRDLQRSRGSTEVAYLLARHAFDDLGYRRFEWKCDARNRRSRRAAERFGFTMEGVFRQYAVYKGRNRDTAWFAMTDGDWPLIKEGFEKWLDGANFDAAGMQMASLAEVRDRIRSRRRAGDAAPAISIRPVTAADEEEWRRLWREYNTFYEVALPEATTAATWRRILDPDEPFGSILAESHGRVVGFANLVIHQYTWSERPACLMEDLFVDPEARGSGAGRALISHLEDLCRENRWSKLYWITQTGNATARRLYDTFTPPDDFVQYTIPFR